MDVISEKGGVGYSELEDNFNISQVQTSERSWLSWRMLLTSTLKTSIQRKDFIKKMPAFWLLKAGLLNLMGMWLFLNSLVLWITCILKCFTGMMLYGFQSSADSSFHWCFVVWVRHSYRWYISSSVFHLWSILAQSWCQENSITGRCWEKDRKNIILISLFFIFIISHWRIKPSVWEVVGCWCRCSWVQQGTMNISRSWAHWWDAKLTQQKF